MRIREILALGSLAFAAAWFAWPARQLSDQLLQARAQETRALHLAELIQGLRSASPSELPSGEAAAQARELLTEALELELLQHTWPTRALGLLDEEQRALVAQGGPAVQGRSRSHPHTPSEVLAIVEVLGERYGASSTPLPPLPPTPPIPGLSPQEQVRGLLALSREAELSPELAARIQACALAGIHAHERAPEAITELAEVLGPGLVEQGMDSPGPRDLEELEAQGLEALARLEGR